MPLNCWKYSFLINGIGHAVFNRYGEQTVSSRECSMMRNIPMWALGVILSLVLFQGCVSFDMNEAEQVNKSSAMQARDDAEQTLAAVRALFPTQQKPAPSVPETSDKRSSESDAPSWPPDWLSQYFSSERSSGQESDLLSTYGPSASFSPSKPRAVRPDVPVRIPRAIAPSSHSSQTEPTPRVPAYTVPAPIGSAFPGSSRCTPDLLGGQRCHVN